MEILWTGIHSLFRKDFRLVSTTSIWMFFIYGLAVFLEPICNITNGFPVLVRGGIYTVCIFTVEYVTGRLLKLCKLCPWDYSGSPLCIKGVIRLDYAPVWFVAGLIFEGVYHLLQHAI